MDATLQGYNVPRLPEYEVNLQRAVRTLRALRERYEAGSDAGSGCMRAYTVQVALGYTDMLWITAAIEALEKAAPASSN